MNKNDKQSIIGFLTKEEYEEGYILAFRNAKSLLNVALSAADIQEFGVANGLIILSAEELSKAFILKIKSLDNHFPINNLYKYFSNHRTKQESIINLVSSLLFQESDTEAKEKTNNKDENLVFGILILIGIIILTVAYFHKKEKKDNSKDKNSNQQNDKYFDEIKESGFYLGFDYDNKKWKSPLEINTEEKFNEYKDVIEGVFDLVEKAIFEDINVIEDAFQILDSIEDDNIDKDYLNKLKRKAVENKI